MASFSPTARFMQRRRAFLRPPSARPASTRQPHVAGALIALVLLAVSAISPAQAGMPVQQETTCPVGGKKFTYTTTYSYTISGARPDGKPYGTWRFPLALPECPDNGLVIYRAFKPEQIKRLTELVLGPDYQALRREMPYYRAAWLMEKMGDRSALDRLGMINQASWQADHDPARKARYQREFAEGMDALAAQPNNMEWLAIRVRSANAWRELGGFNKARAALSSIPRATLDVPAPPANDRSESATKAKSKRDLRDLITSLETAIARGDTTSEPLDMMPLGMAAKKCLRMEQAQKEGGPPPQPLCKSPAIDAKATEMREWEAKRQMRQQEIMRQQKENETTTMKPPT